MRTLPRNALIAVLVALALQVAFWSQTRHLRAGWEGVPPAPSRAVARALALGDNQFLYRTATYTLQNMGDEGGRVTPLTDYDYVRLGRWFALLDGLDPESDYLPVLAGYYFGATQKTGDVRVVVDYLARLAARDPGRNWRWYVHAVFLARHRIGDMELALSLAERLAAIEAPGLPVWTRQMPAFVLADLGENEAARAIIEAILLTDPNLAPAEINFMQDFLETRLK